MAEVDCGQCGHRNPTGANYCSSCGAPLGAAGVDDHELTGTFAALDDSGIVTEADVPVRLDDLPPGTAVVIIQRGPGSGSRFLLDTDVITAGRHPESDVFLDDVTVSRRHAEIQRRGDDWIVRDADSLNGTYVNRTRIDGDVTLHDRDELQVGRFKLLYLRTT